MKRNFFVTLVAYIGISIISVITAAMIIGTFFDDSGILNEKLYAIAAALLVLHFCLTISLYIFGGYLYFRPTQSKIRNVISIWWIAIVLFLIIVAVSFNGISSDAGIFILYSNPYSGFVVLGTELLINSDISDKQRVIMYSIIFTITALIPSFGLWVGMLMRRRKTEKAANLVRQ